MRKLLRLSLIAMVLLVVSFTPVYGEGTPVDVGNVLVGQSMDRDDSHHYYYILGVLTLTGGIVSMYRKGQEE